jgi:hypothetical protein
MKKPHEPISLKAIEVLPYPLLKAAHELQEGLLTLIKREAGDLNHKWEEIIGNLITKDPTIILQRFNDRGSKAKGGCRQRIYYLLLKMLEGLPESLNCQLVNV